MHTLVHVIDATSLDLRRFIEWSSSFPDPYREPVAASDQGKVGFDHLQFSFQNALHEFAKKPYLGALLFTGLPICADVAPTPTRPFSQAGLERIGSEALLFSISSAFGDPYSYREWEGGLLVHNLYPIRQHATVQLGSNSVLLRMHTEKPFRDISPDYVSLLCLRGDPSNDAITYLCDIHRIVEALPFGSKELLRMPLYAFETDNPHLVRDGVGYTMPRPIVRERDGRVIYEYVDYLSALTEESKHVLNILRTTITETATEVRLSAGDLLIMDNSHVVHGRSPYQPSYDGADSWLQRLLISRRTDKGNLSSTEQLIADSCISGYASEYQMLLKREQKKGSVELVSD
ncbi:TauD/TfdA family dioxygenase [Bradyrhizobium sp. 2S1]|uniref:TauD/TfdA family dioxygenase n=1 Tax=Bradyrhizobium sp. 2S1 TaxID=1404429 RepID=UPI00140A0121|nr:TauD/TfdA family dioxygenase [Bradyrhizobium sp. 2S1]MCK7668260.1 TauD/TfdA family dioxygenase [Bradyrhizobium sp. 2S1]